MDLYELLGGVAASRISMANLPAEVQVDRVLSDMIRFLNTLTSTQEGREVGVALVDKDGTVRIDDATFQQGDETQVKKPPDSKDYRTVGRLHTHPTAPHIFAGSPHSAADIHDFANSTDWISMVLAGPHLYLLVRTSQSRPIPYPVSSLREKDAETVREVSSNFIKDAKKAKLKVLCTLGLDWKASIFPGKAVHPTLRLRLLRYGVALPADAAVTAGGRDGVWYIAEGEDRKVAVVQHPDGLRVMEVLSSREEQTLPHLANLRGEQLASAAAADMFNYGFYHGPTGVDPKSLVPITLKRESYVG